MKILTEFNKSKIRNNNQFINSFTLIVFYLNKNNPNLSAQKNNQTKKAISLCSKANS